MASKISKAKEVKLPGNTDFVQVYKAGWETIQKLIRTKSRSTLKVYIYLLSKMTKNGVVYASQQDIARDLDISISTVKRNISYLIKESKSIVSVKTHSSVNMYGINPKEAWRSTSSEKENSLYKKGESSRHLTLRKDQSSGATPILSPVSTNSEIDKGFKNAVSFQDMSVNIIDEVSHLSIQQDEKPF